MSKFERTAAAVDTAEPPMHAYITCKKNVVSPLSHSLYRSGYSPTPRRPPPLLSPVQ